MSHNQPGPYGGQPRQPGPYGAPGPYGPPPRGPGGAPQPGYGPPRQPPQPAQGLPPQGLPPQPPGYGYPRAPQPGPYGPQPHHGAGRGAYPSPPPPPARGGGRRKAPAAGGAVAALAVVAGCAWWLTSGRTGSGVAADTKGYRLTPAASAGGFEKDKDSTGRLSAEEKSEAEALLGVRGARKAGANYTAGDPERPLNGRALSPTGLWGEIDDPEKALDGWFRELAEGGGDGSDDVRVEFAGKAADVEPAGFEGALMKCRTARLTPAGDAGSAGPGAKASGVPMCAWADFSTVAGVDVVGLSQILGGGGGAVPQREVAEPTAEPYGSSRTKV